MIELRGVNKHFGSHHVLRDISESIGRGEVVVICGPSGSGKSTLIRTINRLEEIDSGQIRVDGRDIHAPGTRIDQFRSGIGFVFQQFNLFPHLTVLDNCTLAPIHLRGLAADVAEAKALALLEQVGVAEKAAAFRLAVPGKLAFCAHVLLVGLYSQMSCLRSKSSPVPTYPFPLITKLAASARIEPP